MKKILILFLMITPLFAGDVVIVMGPSCGGKSTYSKKLTSRLNNNEVEKKWVYIDLDDVIDDAKVALTCQREKLAVEKKCMRIGAGDTFLTHTSTFSIVVVSQNSSVTKL